MKVKWGNQKNALKMAPITSYVFMTHANVNR